LVFLGVVLWIIPNAALAQNSTNSPYTRYGYGNLADKSFISQRGMGGIGYGLRNPQMINPMNPASFSSVDSMTFMFDFGITGQMSWLKEGTNRENPLNGNLEYIAMQFPVAKRFGVGAGFEPISSVGYQYMAQSLRVDNSSRVDSGLDINSGTGGLSRVYAILSYDLLNQLSVGVKLSYMFGDITRDILHTYSVSNPTNSNWTDTIRSYGFLYDLGIQYHHEIGKFKRLTIGAVYSPKIRFGAKLKSDTLTIDPATLMIMSATTAIRTNSVFEMPETYGLGFTYSRVGKLTAGADVLYQRWADVKYDNQSNVFNNRLKVNAGGEFIPNRTNNSLLSRIRYRGGLYYENSYIIVKGLQYHEYGATLGLGVPVSDKRSFINLALEYSRVQPEVNLPLSEQYFKISLSYTFNELWFRKLKVQ
jgi:hypothetical protein